LTGLAFAVCTGIARADQAPLPVGEQTIVVAADQVEYFSDAALIAARGSVLVSLPDGASVSGDAFSMDLKLKRLIVAGHVILRTPAGVYAGAAFADFLPYRRGYFVSLDPAADRWTFLDSNYAEPLRGRAMPGDAFFLPDVSGLRPYVAARRAVIDPVTYARFAPAAVDLVGFIDSPNLPSFVDNFSPNPNFGVNSLAGATFDAPYDFAGTAGSLEAVHLRHNQSAPVKDYLSFEHHSIFGDAGYAVFSVNPATQPSKQWDLVGYDPLGGRSALALDAQLFTQQRGLTTPSSASGFADAIVVGSLPSSSLRLDLTQTYDTFVNGPAPPNHPFIAGLQWAGFEQPIGASGFSYRLTSGVCAIHDVFGVSGFSEPNVYTHYAGVTVASPTVPGPLRTSVDATYAVAQTWLTFPNWIGASTFTASAGRVLADRLFATASLVIASSLTSNPSAVVVSTNSSSGLVPQPASPNGLPVLGGVATSFARATNRAYVLTLAWQPSAGFQLAGALEKNVYSPLQAPPPYQLSLSVRTKITKSLYLDVSRGNSFGWMNQRWTPQFGLQVSAQ